jgi:hypothetical protein
MPSPVKRFAKPKVMTIPYGKGHLKAKVIGTYKRGKTRSHYIPELDSERTAKKAGKGMKYPASYHIKYPQASDTPKTRI